MQSSRRNVSASAKTRSALMAGMGLAMAVTGVCLIVLPVIHDGPVLIMAPVGLLILLAAGGAFYGAFGTLRGEKGPMGAGTPPVRVVTDGPLPPEASARQPWEWVDLARGLAQELEGTGWTVEANDEQIWVSNDIQDNRWVATATRKGTTLARRTVLQREGRNTVVRRDETREVVETKGARRYGRAVDVSSGRSWQMRTQKQVRRGPDGSIATTGQVLATEDLDAAVAEVMKAAGWRAKLNAEARGALLVGLIGLSALVLVPLGLLAQHMGWV